MPENALNTTALERLLRAGALGLKVSTLFLIFRFCKVNDHNSLHLFTNELCPQSFMCPSGINDFPMTNITHIKVTIFHSELKYVIICDFE